MSTREIEEYVRDIYGVDASASLVSKITDRIMPEVREWQARPLDDIYPAVFFDGVWFKGRSDGKVVKNAYIRCLARKFSFISWAFELVGGKKEKSTISFDGKTKSDIADYVYDEQLQATMEQATQIEKNTPLISRRTIETFKTRVVC